MYLDARANDEITRIRNEEGNSLSSIRYFPKLGEVRLLVVTDRVKHRVTEYVPSNAGSLMVIKASPDEWDSKQLDLVPLDWRQEPIYVM